eukprot:2588755-Pyramimonas_sp.AAC.1
MTASWTSSTLGSRSRGAGTPSTAPTVASTVFIAIARGMDASNASTPRRSCCPSPWAPQTGSCAPAFSTSGWSAASS